MFDFLKSETTKEKVLLPTKESAWMGGPNVFTLRDFAQYNPDVLIGTKGFAIYRKMMQDYQVKAVVKFRRDAITSRDWFFEIEDPDMEDEERDRRTLLMGSIIEQMEKPKWFDALNGIMSATYNGFSMTEKTFKQIEYDDKTWWGIKRLRLKPFDTFYFTIDEVGELVRVHQEVHGKSHDIEIENFIHFVQNPDVDENYGRSELREAYDPFFAKQHCWKWWLIWVERHAGGFKWIQPKEGQTIQPNSEEFTALQTFLSNATVGSSGLLPGSVELKFEWPQNNVSFSEVIKDADLAIAKSLLVPNLLGVTPETGAGSLARAETQLDAFMWTLDADAARLEGALNDGIFEQLSELNFGGDPREWPRFRFKPLSDEAEFKLITLWKDLVGSRVVTNSEIDEDHIRNMVDFPKRVEEEDLPDTGIKDEEEDDDLPDNEDEDEDNPSPPETVIGRGGKLAIENKRRFKSSVVEFQIIGRRSEEIIEAGTDNSTDVVNDIVRDLLVKIDGVDLDSGKSDDSGKADLDTLVIDSADKQKLRRTIRASMRTGWSLGTRHSENEIQRARDTTFTANKERLKFVSEEFFDIRSFVSTGRVVDEIRATVNTVVLQGAKTGQHPEQIKAELVRQLSIKGLLSREIQKEVLGAIIDNIVSPNSYLNTLIRTVVFEAVNEARFAVFVDPELDGFVQALEYTAILDSRTTQICNHMDGRTYPIDSDVWSAPTSWRPPNHFNCRSLLIPVSKFDTWTESERPTIFPQEGFG